MAFESRRGNPDQPDRRQPRAGRNPFWPGGVFISYRRDDSAGHAGRLYDRLRDHFGEQQIFMDIDAIEPGVDFTRRIHEAMTACRVVLVVIGPNWLAAADQRGNRRLDDPQDYLRMEITEALARDVRVIPVLVRGATVPSTADLPEGMKGLATRNAHELSDTRWGFDTARLIEAIERVLREDPAPDAQPDGSRRVPVAYLIVLLIALVAGGGMWLLFTRPSGGGSGGGDGGGSSAKPSPAASPPHSPSPSAEPTTGVLAFVSDRSGNREIWTTNIDGTPIQVTELGACELVHPDWSPDGRRLVFASNARVRNNTDGDFEVWTINVDGSDLRQLTDNLDIRDAAPDWSPDGSRIAFSSARSEGDTAEDDLDIWTIDSSDGQDLQRLTDNDHDDDTPDWSPKGEQIIWETRPGDSHDIYRMNADGSDPVPVVRGPGGDYWPMWSPDGDRIAYRSNEDGGFDIYIATAQGDNVTPLTSDGAANHRPTWSPDGRQLAFDKETDGLTDLWVVASSGGEARRLTDNDDNDDSAAWRPSADGR